MFTTTFHELRDDTDEQIVERVAYQELLRSEILPDEPPIDVQQVIASTRALPARYRRVSFRVRDADGNLAANATTTFDAESDNPDVLEVGINVLPVHRRNGVGTQLLCDIVGLAQREGKTRLIGGTFPEIPAGGHFAETVGAEAKQAVHVNHLPLGEVDRPMLEGWITDAATRTSDYELIGWDGPVPDEHMDRWLDLVVVMNTAPLDDLELNDFTVTAEQIREGERMAEATGQEEWVLVARHRTTGAWAGFHNVAWDPGQPTLVFVGSTGVKPEHRGHALGKWLKAAMTIRILDERPDVTNVRTGNADSNDAMLGINKAMGYRPLIAQTTWELPVEVAAQWLRQRGVDVPTT